MKQRITEESNFYFNNTLNTTSVLKPEMSVPAVMTSSSRSAWSRIWNHTRDNHTPAPSNINRALCSHECTKRRPQTRKRIRVNNNGLPGGSEVNTHVLCAQCCGIECGPACTPAQDTASAVNLLLLVCSVASHSHPIGEAAVRNIKHVTNTPHMIMFSQSKPIVHAKHTLPSRAKSVMV